MKKLILLLLLIPTQTFSQTNEAYNSQKESLITIDLFSPFIYIHQFGRNYYTPRWRLGYLKQISEKSRIGIDLGYGNANTSLYVETGSKYKLWEIRPEYFYTIKNNIRNLKYLSIEMFYINQNETFFSDSFISRTNKIMSYEKASYTRHKFGIIPKIGMFLNLGKHIGFNFYTGIGLNYRINNYSNFLNLTDGGNISENSPTYYGTEGGKLGVEFSLGLKLFYRIKTNANNSNRCTSH